MVGIPGIYQHGLNLVFEGGYLNALHYLQTLESLPWGLFWDSVEFKVEKYPMARFTITCTPSACARGGSVFKRALPSLCARLAGDGGAGCTAHARTGRGFAGSNPAVVLQGQRRRPDATGASRIAPSPGAQCHSPVANAGAAP